MGAVLLPSLGPAPAKKGHPSWLRTAALAAASFLLAGWTLAGPGSGAEPCQRLVWSGAGGVRWSATEGAAGGGAGDGEVPWEALQRRIAALQAVEVAAWHEAEVDGPVPSARLWPSLTPLEGGSARLFMFGGINASTGRMLNDAWLLELPSPQREKAIWRRLDVFGDLPPGRAHHDAVLVQGRFIVVHGGLLGNGCRSDDTWRLDLESAILQWLPLGITIDTPDRPIPRYHHTLLASASGKVVLFGGHDYARQALDDVWVIDAGDTTLDPWSVGWRELEGLGPGPSPRAYHAAVMLGSWMLVSGGELQGGSSCSEIWVLDVDGEAWRRVGKDLAQGGRMRHAMCCVEADTESARGVVALCGGHGREVPDARPLEVALLRLEDGGQGSNIPCVEIQAPPRHPETSQTLRREAVLLSLDSGHVVLFGGNDGELVDGFGDGYHQCGFSETLVADAPKGSVGGWRRITAGPLRALAQGSAVAALSKSGQVIVVDHDVFGDGSARVHTLSLSVSGSADGNAADAG